MNMGLIFRTLVLKHKALVQSPQSLRHANWRYSMKGRIILKQIKEQLA